MRNGTFYLNNSGSRWVVLKDGKHDMPFYLLLKDGTYKLRQADYYTTWGNWSCIVYRYKGVQYRSIPDDESLDGIPIIKECGA